MYAPERTSLICRPTVDKCPYRLNWRIKSRESCQVDKSCICWQQMAVTAETERALPSMVSEIERRSVQIACPPLPITISQQASTTFACVKVKFGISILIAKYSSMSHNGSVPTLDMTLPSALQMMASLPDIDRLRSGKKMVVNIVAEKNIANGSQCVEKNRPQSDAVLLQIRSHKGYPTMLVDTGS